MFLLEVYSMKYITTLTLVAVCFVCSAKIIEANTMDDVYAQFDGADENTLAVFDVDLVLVQPGDPAFQMANMKKYGSICKKIMQQLPEDKRNVFLSLMSLQSTPELIDKRTPDFLRGLSLRGVPAIALTANLSGSVKNVDNMERWRVDSLHKLGIDFTRSAPYKDDIVFSDLPAYRNNFSVYTGGILFANGTMNKKGDVLLAFFDKADYMPKKVIFVDDREENLTNVEAALQRADLGIDYVGVHFIGAKDIPSVYISEDDFEQRWMQLSKQAL